MNNIERPIMSGPEPKESESQLVKKITRKDLRPVLPEVGASTIVLQRNAKDNRSRDAENFGALTPEAREQTRTDAREYFDRLFSELSPEERATLDVLVVASDAKLFTPSGANSEHQRSVETAREVMQGLHESMTENQVDEKQLLNNSAFAEFAEPSGPIEFSDLTDLRMMTESPEYVDFLKKKYGDGEKFWIAFEEDTEKETRLQMKAEGPKEIANRIEYFLRMVNKAAEEHHKENPGRRLVIWSVSHYDSISPFAKEHVLGIDQGEYLPVETGGGITFETKLGEPAKTSIGGQEYQVDLELRR